MISLTNDDLRNLRAKAGLTQEEAARILGVSIGTLRNWEQGRSRIFPLTAKGIEKTFSESYEVNLANV